MKSIVSLLKILGLTFAISSCSNNISVESDFNQSIRFTNFKTYRWHKPNQYNENSRTYLANDIVDQRIRESVDQQLKLKGYSKQESGEVNFLVNYSVSTEERIDVDTYNTYGGFAPGWSYGGYYGRGPYRYGGVGVRYNVGTVDTRVRYYQQGTFFLDIILPSNNTLIWRGSAEGKLNKNITAQERLEVVQEVVTRVLQNFPPEQD